MLGSNNASPLNSFPLWKYILIGVIIILGVLYALPNWYGESPAVQISPKNGTPITPALVQQIESTLTTQHLAYHNLTTTEYTAEMRFADTTTQMKAQDDLEQALGKNYTVAINLAPNTPRWMQMIGANPMKLGLDLRGGMYFLLDIDMQSVVDNNLQNTIAELRDQLRQQDIRYSNIQLTHNSSIALSFRTEAAQQAAQAYIRKTYPQLVVSKNPAEPLGLLTTMNPQDLKQLQQYAVDQTVQVMRNRVNELGVSEASVTKQGLKRVAVELPGVQDAARAKAILGGTATLKVMLVNEQADASSAAAGNVPIGSVLYTMENGTPVVLKDRVVLTGKSIVGASTGFDSQTNLPVVNVRLSGPEVSTFSEVTGDNVGHLMAIVLVKQSFTKQVINGKTVTQTRTHNTVINVATIESQLGSNFQITGIGSLRSAQNLALMIRAGALPAPVQIVEEMQIGPSLGAQNIKMGEISVAVALLLVMIFIALYYRVFGLIANVALILNLVFLVAIMSIIPGATLTLPGIAAIVLHVGMAIDCNVLIFERIREELRNGVTPQAAIHAGFTRAFATVVDSNVTTLIVALILFGIGTGSIKGFAVVLIIGILTSMFTAVTVTRGLINLIYGGRSHVKRLSIGI